jgi:hypothetical protein
MKGEAPKEAYGEERKDSTSKGQYRNAETGEADDDDRKNELDDAECNEAPGIERDVLPSGWSRRRVIVHLEVRMEITRMHKDRTMVVVQGVSSAI